MGQQGVTQEGRKRGLVRPVRLLGRLGEASLAWPQLRGRELLKDLTYWENLRKTEILDDLI